MNANNHELEISVSLESRLVLLIQIDALRRDYLIDENAPFLTRLAKEGKSGMLSPSFGFEPDGAYLAGLYPDECDGGAHYWYAPESSPFGFARYLPRFLDSLPSLPKKVFRRLLSVWVCHSTGYKQGSVANIPLNVLPSFAPAHKHLPWEPQYLEQPTIFSICDNQNIPWLVHAAPEYPVNVKSGVVRLKRDLKPPIGFAFWHIGDLDKAGHRFGPDSVERRTAMRQVDAGINELFSQLAGVYDQINLVIIGDHGMAEVRGTVDVQNSLLDAGIKQGEGVQFFLDSTMARFWFFEERAKHKVYSILENVLGGKTLDRTDRDHIHLNYSHNRFGDLFFLANPGMLISPNFFQGARLVKGMHGYAPECPEQQSAFIIHSSGIAASKKIEQPVDMRRIFPTVLELLGLERPPTCQVESIL